jgi:hypothetical protein
MDVQITKKALPYYYELWRDGYSFCDRDLSIAVRERVPFYYAARRQEEQQWTVGGFLRGDRA